MFCPSCGSEDRQASQFCRACGTDLGVVRRGLERPDTITASAANARAEIGRAVADKIRGINDPHQIRRFADMVLPRVEKFLESPEEKRLRRLRSGTITSLIGLAVGCPATFIALNVAKHEPRVFFAWLAILALVTLGTGLGLLINGLLFSRPRQGVWDNSDDARMQNLLDAGYSPPPVSSSAPSAFRAQTTSNLEQPRNSVTEHTTLHLGSER